MLARESLVIGRLASATCLPSRKGPQARSRRFQLPVSQEIGRPRSDALAPERVRCMLQGVLRGRKATHGTQESGLRSLPDGAERLQERSGCPSRAGYRKAVFTVPGQAALPQGSFTFWAERHLQGCLTEQASLSQGRFVTWAANRIRKSVIAGLGLTSHPQG